MGRRLSVLHDTEIKFETFGLEAGEDIRTKFELDIFDIPSFDFATKKEKLQFDRRTRYGSEFLDRLEKKLNSRVIVREHGNFPYNKEFISKSKKNTYLRGLWQSELYFKEIDATIRKDFVFKEPMEGKNLELAQWLSKVDNTVSLHVRRGEFAKDPGYSQSIGTCDMDYYERAINHMNEHVKDAKYIVFSDDIEWSRENLPLGKDEIFVDYNMTSHHYRDMQLMSLCKHNIIANSTFSWWGAWLNANKDKIVIAPVKWFAGFDHDTKDLIPDQWIRL